MAVSNKNRNTKTHIVKSQAELEALLAGGTVSFGDVIEFNGVSTTVFNGTTAPTTSTVAFSKGDFYVDTTNNKLYYCANITVASNVYTYTWVEIATKSGGSSLDATLVPNKQYIIGNQSATFAMTLPATGSYNDYIEVIFTATAAFTPTSSGGTVIGDTLPTTIANKTYDLMFTWVGSGWLLQYLAW